jgi:soluble lytic murein transglycosylase-like protein
VIEQESEWNPWAIRAEPAFDEKYVRPLHKTPTEEWARSISWGLMQLMGESARERGYDGDLAALCDPEIGVPWGCAHLKWKIDHAGGDVARGLQAWNGGGNPNYASEVLARVSKYR